MVVEWGGGAEREENGGRGGARTSRGTCHLSLNKGLLVCSFPSLSDGKIPDLMIRDTIPSRNINGKAY